MPKRTYPFVPTVAVDLPTAELLRQHVLPFDHMDNLPITDKDRAVCAFLDAIRKAHERVIVFPAGSVPSSDVTFVLEPGSEHRNASLETLVHDHCTVVAERLFFAAASKVARGDTEQGFVILEEKELTEALIANPEHLENSVKVALREIMALTIEAPAGQARAMVNIVATVLYQWEPTAILQIGFSPEALPYIEQIRL